MEDNKNITGIILAGGKSSRMGTDKGFIPLEGKLFINHIIDALKPLVNTIIIVSDHIHYDTLGYKRIEDVFPDTGPLSGLYSGLRKSDSDLNFVLSCDIPLISSEILKELLNRYAEETNAVVCKVNKAIMPLVALYNKNCISRCKELLDNDERRMMRLLERLDTVKYVSLNEDQAQQVKNINNIKDLNTIKMQVEIKYFGMLAEITGCNTEQLEVSSPKIAGLKETLLNKYPDFKNKDFRIAQNQEIIGDTALLTGQEIAVLPPFAGG